MKNIFALVISFVVLSSPALAFPAARGECAKLNESCGTGYMLSECCPGTECNDKDSASVSQSRLAFLCKRRG
ncbi:hypothetical protein RSOLAG1IB_08148 [Rhizoctonia solani AG-1 IB]|uniref:Uncharacterized protein n=1 Tax=Thanatephorus cucumeris (strain AG1-IB / isolate 7/3/14) TaxID=1108050 RepID=A0A0B7FGV2_THACB|nr:hypothetical protein RSOLAG1IB_08148 [Rhizoctonia solani AG-1 IB]